MWKLPIIIVQDMETTCEWGEKGAKKDKTVVDDRRGAML